MVKLSILAATLLLVLAISNATVYQTTIITSDEAGSSENQGGQSQRCRQQIQSQRQQFQQCEEYIRQQAQPQGGPGAEDVLILRGVRNTQTFDQCCEALGNMEQECQCQGLREIVERMQKQQGQGQKGQQGQQQEEMMQIAQQMPQRCRTGQSCKRMHVVWF